MNRIVAALVTATAVGSLLAGCGGDSPYCAAVKENQKALETFNAKPSTKTYTTYAEAVKAIRAEAPAAVKSDWTKLGTAIDGVLAAQKKADIPLEDVADTSKVEQLDSDDLATLKKAYDAFNKTAPQRKAIVADIQKTCDVSLAPDKEK